MADVRQKLTDKTDLTDIQDADLVHVVDVSDTTSSPEGTSKKGTWEFLKDALKLFLDPFYTTSSTATRIISGGMVWKEDLTYESVDLIYEVNGIQFTITDGTEATLNAAPTTPTFERFDVIYGDNDGNILIEEGTESATPTIPALQTSFQLELTVALLLTNATEPDGVAIDTVYEEDLGQPTEYDVTEDTGGARIDVADASTPISGTVSIKCIANLITGDTITAVHATPIQVDEFSYLRMSIKSLRNWRNDFIEVRLKNVSTVVATFKINKRVIDVTNVSTVQILTIFKANFSSYSDTEFDNIDFYNRSTNRILYILDDIFIQTGVDNNEPTTGIGADETTVDVSAFNNNLSVADNTVQKALDTLDDLSLGTGDVSGPGSAVDENITVFDSTTGKLIKDSTINISAVTANTAKNTNIPMATDVIWDAAGDLAVGTGANTGAKLSKGTALQQLRVNSGATALEWATPAGGGDMVLADVQTVTGAKTFENLKFILRNVADTFNAFFTNTNTADRTYTLPDESGTIALLSDIHGELMGYAFNDETTSIEAGTDVLSYAMPNFATVLTHVSVNLKTAPTGSTAIFDLNEGGVSVLSTKISIDATETNSETAATPPVISDSAIAANAIMTLDIDQKGSTIAGVAPKMWLYFTRA